MNQPTDCLINDSDQILPENICYSSSRDDAIDRESNHQLELSSPPKKTPQYIAAISATMSSLAAGAVLAWTSPILIELENSSFNKIPVNKTQLGWIGSFVTLGAMTMCIPTGFICDIIGRRRTLLCLLLPFTIGWALIYYSTNIVMLYFGRLFTGMAAGACCVAAPLYTSEISHKSIRGALGSYFQLMVTLGVFFAYLFGKYLDPYYFTLLCASFPLLFVVTFVFQPESPVYLLKKGLYDEAKHSLLRLRGNSYDVDEELRELEGVLKDHTQTAISLSETFRRSYVIKALIISFALMFFQQFSGINIIILYCTDIFQASGISLDANTATILVGLFQVIATFFASLMVDRLGRRCLLLISTTVISLSNILLALYFTLKYRMTLSGATINEIGFLPVGSLCVFVIVFSLGLGPIPWLISSEIFAPEIRSICGSAAGTFNWFLAFIITKFYKEVADCIGEDSVFYLCGVFSIIGALFVFYLVPETKGKSITEIQNDLE